MDKFMQIKEIISPLDIAEKYLGSPDKKANNKLWYKSPLRQEKTASFSVDDVGFYDFGTNQYYDVVKFASAYFNVRPIEAVDILAKDFNISLEDNKLSTKEIERLKKEREQRKEQQKVVTTFFKNLQSFIIDELKKTNKEIDKLDLYSSLCQKFYNESNVREEKEIFLQNIDKTVEKTFPLYKYKENLIYIDTLIEETKDFKDKERLYNLNLNIREVDKKIKKVEFLEELVNRIKKDSLLSFDYEKIKEAKEIDNEERNIYNYLNTAEISKTSGVFYYNRDMTFKKLKNEDLDMLPLIESLACLENRGRHISCSLIKPDKSNLGLVFSIHSLNSDEWDQNSFWFDFKDIDFKNISSEEELINIMTEELDRFDIINKENIKKFSEEIHFENLSSNLSNNNEEEEEL